MFYLAQYPEDPPGYAEPISTAAAWEPWLNATIPAGLDAGVQNRLRSNLKHILVGLEMKAALIVPHAIRVSKKAVLFESYSQLLTFEFCVGVFSVCEGIGSALWLRSQNNDGAAAPAISPNDWIGSLVALADPQGALDFDAKVRGVKAVRDKIHQDRLGARAEIDWHAFDYNQAFVPAKEALGIVLRLHAASLPAKTNLN
ncbi:MAG: hypothetical protein E5X33_27190 [Mesorhizobium sp.]|uniref:hypothetical protein n=1 Tax=Mesorhizobium sp. TaxID=1871066 RepID=UPI0011F6B4A5|nr:hypothetical protein [Mesorhizobium sp.]TIR17128.1 MAG: hypothetical protein E5X33_27190 [Mesorhizobium sp.]